jgi:hypothetical protein
MPYYKTAAGPIKFNNSDESLSAAYRVPAAASRSNTGKSAWSTGTFHKAPLLCIRFLLASGVEEKPPGQDVAAIRNLSPICRAGAAKPEEDEKR